MLKSLKSNSEIMGKKIFFLYPHSVIQSDMLDILVKHEYEVYMINDHLKMLKLAEFFPDSILFINIDEKLSETKWESFISNMLDNNKLISRIGILTYNKNKDLAQKYLMDIMIPCGFIVLNISFEQSAATILKMLHANEAKGRRKFLRTSCQSSENIRFNLKLDNILYTGAIVNISIVGMAICFDTDIFINLKSYIKDIQLQLKGIICRVSGIVIANRDAEKGEYILMFHKADENTGEKIHSFIHNQHQLKMDDIIKTLS